MELTWDLTQIYKDYSQLDKDVEILKTKLNEACSYKNKLNNKQNLLGYYKLSEEISLLQGKIYAYLTFLTSLDGSDYVAMGKAEEIESLVQQYGKKLAFISSELKRIPNKLLNEWKNLPEFEDYNLAIDEIIKDKKHMLTEDKEKLLIGAESYANFDSIFDCLNNVEIKFGKIKDENGNIVKLTRANYGKFVESNNKRVRKSAQLKMFGAYKAVNQTISANYISHLKYVDFIAKTYKYKSVLDECMISNDLPNNLPRKVVEKINKYLPILHKYYAWRKKFMKLDKFESCDSICNLFDKEVTVDYSLDDCIKILKQALLPLGKDYVSMLDKAIKDCWIDSRYLPNKQSGGYQLSCYGVHPFILLTYDNTFDSVSTIAHEFGHSMHSYYSEKSQPYSKCNYKIFVAEVASTVNEILLSNYMINNSKNKQEKINYITEFLGRFISTIFAQTEYTEFELFVHDKIDKNEPLIYKMLNDCYYNLQKKYYGKNVKVIPDSKFHWSRIPHFYSDFYVFQYATSFVAACAIAQKLLTDKDYYKTYRQFLSAGCTKKPCELLKDAGVDILSDAAYGNAFKLFSQYLSELEELS